MKKQTRYLHEVVELTRACDLGAKGERAVVVFVDAHSLTLVFPARESCHVVRTGADYTYLARVDVTA